MKPSALCDGYVYNTAQCLENRRATTVISQKASIMARYCTALSLYVVL